MVKFSLEDRALLREFLNFVLTKHRDGEIVTAFAVGTIETVFAIIDRGDPFFPDYMRAILREGWRNDA